jgi:hypothetical protein
MVDESSDSGHKVRNTISRRKFLKFAGAIGFGIVAAPFIGSI